MHGGGSLLEQGSLRLEQVDEDPEMSIAGEAGWHRPNGGGNLRPLLV